VKEGGGLHMSDGGAWLSIYLGSTKVLVLYIVLYALRSMQQRIPVDGPITHGSREWQDIGHRVSDDPALCGLARDWANPRSRGLVGGAI